MEAYSGLSLDRPKLSELRDLIRNKEIDIVIAYALDRFSRDPVHFILLQDEMEKHGVNLLFVTETVDSSDLGKLISHIRGYAAKLETVKIKERTSRGLRERVKSGRLPAGQQCHLYGYTYIPGKGVGEGIRIINEDTAKWVREVYRWFTEEGLGIERIAFRLRDLGIPTATGKGMWMPTAIWSMLKNEAYTGKTWVNQFKPRSEWIEIPDATPAIISQEIYDVAQVQLQRNREKSSRNNRHDYLLSGHMFCKRCGRPYWGFWKNIVWNNIKHAKRYYHCAGKFKREFPNTCDNKNFNADKVEAIIWEEIENVLAKPEIILESLGQQTGNEDKLIQELKEIKSRLTELDKEQLQLLQWALKGFPENTVIADNNRINTTRGRLKVRETELTNLIEQNKQAREDITGVKNTLELIKSNTKNPTFEVKRQALEWLRIKVWVDGTQLSISGVVNPGLVGSNSSAWQKTNKPIAFSLVNQSNKKVGAR